MGVGEGGRESGQGFQVLDMFLEVGPEGDHARGGPCADEQEDALSFFPRAET